MNTLFNKNDIVTIIKNPPGVERLHDYTGTILIVSKVITKLSNDELGEDKKQPKDLPYYLCKNRWYELYTTDDEIAPINDLSVIEKISKYSLLNNRPPMKLKDLENV